MANSRRTQLLPLSPVPSAAATSHVHYLPQNTQIALGGAAIPPGVDAGLTWSGAAGWAGRCTGRGRRCCSASGSEGTSGRTWGTDGERHRSGHGPPSAHPGAAAPWHWCCIVGTTSQIHHPGYHSLGTASHSIPSITRDLHDLLAEWGSPPGCSCLPLPAQPKGLLTLNPNRGSCSAREARVKSQDWESPTLIPQCGLQTLPSPAPSPTGWQSLGWLLEVLR